MRGRFFGSEMGAGGSCLHCPMVDPPLLVSGIWYCTNRVLKPVN